MRAQVLQKHGDVDNYVFTETAKRPAVQDGDVLVRVNACGINGLDVIVREGGAIPEYGIHPTLPLIQGSDVVGVIQETGAGVPTDLIGQRVLVYPMVQEKETTTILGIDRPGGFAEYVSVPSNNCIPVPECDLSDAELASLITSGMTAYRMMVEGKVAKGDTVVVTGASGGIGVALIQLCKAKGATIIALCAEEKKERVAKIGAQHVIAHTTENLQDALKACGPIDCVLDVVSQRLTDLFQAIKRKGRYVMGGYADHDKSGGFLPLICWKELEVRGVFLATKEDFCEALDLVAAGILLPVVHQVLALEDLAEAQAFFKKKQFVGKLVIDCAVSDPLPQDGEFMLKCEEIPSCIKWAPKGTMEVVKVGNAKALAASMIPEGATIVPGVRLVRVETARGTVVCDREKIEKKRGTGLKELFADKPTLFLVFNKAPPPEQNEEDSCSSYSVDVIHVPRSNKRKKVNEEEKKVMKRRKERSASRQKSPVPVKKKRLKTSTGNNESARNERKVVQRTEYPTIKKRAPSVARSESSGESIIVRKRRVYDEPVTEKRVTEKRGELVERKVRKRERRNVSESPSPRPSPQRPVLAPQTRSVSHSRSESPMRTGYIVRRCPSSSSWSRSRSPEKPHHVQKSHQPHPTLAPRKVRLVRVKKVERVERDERLERLDRAERVAERVERGERVERAERVERVERRPRERSR